MPARIPYAIGPPIILPAMAYNLLTVNRLIALKE